jgi:hypothetical protein
MQSPVQDQREVLNSTPRKLILSQAAGVWARSAPAECEPRDATALMSSSRILHSCMITAVEHAGQDLAPEYRRGQAQAYQHPGAQMQGILDEGGDRNAGSGHCG